MVKKVLILLLVSLVFANVNYADELESNYSKARTVLEMNNLSFNDFSFYKQVCDGDLENVQLYLNAGMSPDTAVNGFSVLASAIKNNHNEIVECLLKNGADPDQKSLMMTNFKIARKYNNQKASQLLIYYGGSIYDASNAMFTKSREDKDIKMSRVFSSGSSGEDSFGYNQEVDASFSFDEGIDLSSNDYFKANVVQSFNKKDPKLIKLSEEVVPVSDSLYKKKLKSDSLVYKKHQKELKPQVYDIYRIFESVLRANNLQSQNWRLEVKSNSNSVNATASAGNLITINSSLYDSFHNDSDVIAYVISHELSHFILGHIQKLAKNNYEISKYIIKYKKAIYRGKSIYVLKYYQEKIENLYEEQRKMEFEADTEAVLLMLRAGYEPLKAKEALSFFISMGTVYTDYSSHPPLSVRIFNIDAETATKARKDLDNEGKNNIYNSSVLDCVLSIDKRSLIVNRPEDYNNYVYNIQSDEERLLKKAYYFYMNNNFVLAKSAFKEALKQDKKNYIPALYLSYIYENEYLQNNKKSDLNQAMKMADKAFKLNQHDKYTIEQKFEIEAMLANLKEEI
ncbi:MAG: M48 family metalloprotease [Candidatus Gastranaerophilales bacterium]